MKTSRQPKKLSNFFSPTKKSSRKKFPLSGRNQTTMFFFSCLLKPRFCISNRFHRAPQLRDWSRFWASLVRSSRSENLPPKHMLSSKKWNLPRKPMKWCKKKGSMELSGRSFQLKKWTSRKTRRTKIKIYFSQRISWMMLIKRSLWNCHLKGTYQKFHNRLWLMLIVLENTKMM